MKTCFDTSLPMIFTGIAIGFAILYFFLQLYYFIYWQNTPRVVVPGIYSPNTGITIIIVARNEAHSLSRCLEGILHQNFPADLMEVIVVDDHSTDQTIDIIKSIQDPRIKLLRLQDFPAHMQQQAFKKSAITLAVDHAAFEQITVTDADCVHEADWLKHMSFSFSEHAYVFQTGPVVLLEGKNLLARMQETEQLTLMLITGAGITSMFHDLANGANMMFSKTAFQSVGGYAGNTQFASGDDMFLIEKMRKSFPGKIGFVKSKKATVFTKAKPTWASLFSQRLRWAGKNKGLENKTIQWVWLFVGAYHLAMLLFLLAGLLKITSVWPFIIMLTVKWTMDYLLIASSAAFFNRTSLLKYFVPLQLYYTGYVIVLGVKMMLGKEGDWRRE